jgi:NAD(P)-dependent dehydrogenase (short-subunit alcohol dehydrogenase family)
MAPPDGVSAGSAGRLAEKVALVTGGATGIGLAVVERIINEGGIAAAVAFLASDDAAYVSGTSMFVDGGAHHLSYPDTRSIIAAIGASDR